ncbi:uncharacterized protein LOC142589798 isoform X2 [Dermacentor variabilis]|uniref:uncharacterized protein LOC142589798 isoform X2 n=1 Tax=Dermacentor variabilis TaxID=34621 RepID=UPI003F5B5696
MSVTRESPLRDFVTFRSSRHQLASITKMATLVYKSISTGADQTTSTTFGGQGRRTTAHRRQRVLTRPRIFHDSHLP